MNISELNEVIGGEDFARNNMYSIEIYMPRGHKGMGTSGGKGYLGEFYTGADMEKGGAKFLSYKSKQVSLPGKSVGTIDGKRFGPVFKVANDLILDTTSMIFMCGEDYAEHRFFDGWLSAIIGQVKHGTGHSQSSPKKHRQVYTLSYYEDYVGQVNIIPLDRQGGAIANVVLMEAYPSTVGPIEYTWGSEGEIAQFTVTWTYKDWNHVDPHKGWWADPDPLPEGEPFKITMNTTGQDTGRVFS
jgi:hypothetical protein